MNNGRQAWAVALVTLLASMVVNGLLFAYGYGKLEQRMEARERHDAELREDWRAARVRIEATINAIENEMKRNPK